MTESLPREAYYEKRDAFTAFCIPPGQSPASIAEAFRQWPDVPTIFSPAVSHSSGLIVPRESLIGRTALSNNQVLHMGPVPADGLSLGTRQGFTMLTAGCALIIAHGCGHFVAAHASLNSLVDRTRIATGVPSRKHEGVVHAIAHLLTRKEGVDLSDISLEVLFAIHPDEFRYPLDHPMYASFNTKLFEYFQGLEYNEAMRKEDGAISLGAIVRGFASDLGFEGGVYENHRLRTSEGFALGATNKRNLVGVVRHK